MATQLLVNVFPVGPLAPLASTTIAHGLKYADKAVVPTQVICDRGSPLIVSAVNSTSFTVTNPDAAVAYGANFRTEYDHSIHAVGATPIAWQGAAIGAQGPQGPVGPEGPQGPQGPAGGSFPPSYGAFSDSVDQPIPALPASVEVKFDTVEVAGGVTVANDLSGDPTRLTVPATGTYAFDLSPQMAHAGGTTVVISFWAAVNGTPLTNSTSSFEMGNNNNRTLPFIRVFVPMLAGQYFQWFFAVSGGATTKLAAYAAAGGVPANPSVIANVERIA